jgi:hypothetical protein
LAVRACWHHGRQALSGEGYGRRADMDLGRAT